MTEAQVRSFVRDGFVEPSRGSRREFYFSFQDIVVLRAARDLWEQLPAKRVHRALRHLKEHLPSGRALAGVQIIAEGNDVLVRDGSSVWEAESGQAILDFEVADLATMVAPLAEATLQEVKASDDTRTAQEWYELAVELEAYASEEAREAYIRALEIDPEHVESCLNLGRLMHEFGELSAAAEYYRMALDCRPNEGVALFNLGVIYEELEEPARAIEAYEKALLVETPCLDAHYNVARLHEQNGDNAIAIKHLEAYTQALSNRPQRSEQ